jgi:hypothetical protein
VERKTMATLDFAVNSARCGRAATIVVPDTATEKALLEYARATHADFDRLDVKIESLSRIISGNSGVVTFIDDFCHDQ